MVKEQITKQNETPRLIAERIVKTYLDDRINDHQLIGQVEAALNTERERADASLVFVEAYARDGCHHLCSESSCSSLGRLRLKRAKEIAEKIRG